MIRGAWGGQGAVRVESWEVQSWEAGIPNNEGTDLSPLYNVVLGLVRGRGRCKGRIPTASQQVAGQGWAFLPGRALSPAPWPDRRPRRGSLGGLHLVSWPRVLSMWTTVLPDTPSTPTATGRDGSSSARGIWTTCECALHSCQESSSQSRRAPA